MEESGQWPNCFAIRAVEPNYRATDCDAKVNARCGKGTLAMDTTLPLKTQ
jgi:hypothetical protein